MTALGSGERILWRTRTHVKALIGPSLLFLLVAIGFGAAAGFLPERGRPGTLIAAGALCFIVFIAGCLIPFLRWFTTTYTVTNRRIVSRRGILTKTGHDFPLIRVNNVETHQGVIDRMLGCGTLVLTTAAEDPVTLSDVPHLKQVHVMITDLLFTPGEDEAHESRNEDH